jgi:MFS transporter, AAHS family, 3-hydroxyphenylpropionic acid transporter
MPRPYCWPARVIAIAGPRGRCAIVARQMNNENNGNAAGRATRITIALCVAAAFCEGMDLQAPGVAAPGIWATFAPTAVQKGQFLGAGTLGLFFGALIGGWLADRIGRRKVLVGSIFFFGLFSLLNAWAPTYDWLYWTRFITGLGLGGAYPMLVTMVAEASAPERRTANVALTYAGTPTGGVLVSIIASQIDTGHWRSIFVVGGVIPLIITALMWLKLPESAEYSQARAATGERRASAADVLKIFSEGRAVPTLLLWVSFFFGLVTLYLLLNWLPSLMTELGMSGQAAAAAQIGFNVGGALAALLMGRLLSGRWRMASLVAAFVGVPFLIYVLAHAGNEFGTVAAVIFLLGCSVLALQAFLYASGPPIYPTWIRGLGVGAVVAVGRIGSFVGPMVGGELKALGHSPAQLLMDLLPVTLIGSVFAALLALHKPRYKA